MNQITNWLVLLLIFSMPIEQIIVLPGLGTITRVMGLIAFSAWFVNANLTRRIRRPHIFHILAILFFVWSSLSIFWTASLPATLERSSTYMQLAILLLIIWDRLTTRKACHSAMQAYVFGVYVAVGSTISQFLAGNAAKYGRYAAGEFDDNDLGIIISLGIPFAWYLITSRDESKSYSLFDYINLIFIPIAVAGILLTASRTAMISLLPSFIYIILSLRKLKVFQKIAIFFLGIASIVSLPFFIPAETFLRLSTVGDSVSSGDLNGRLDLWREGFQNYAQEPFLGVGSGAFSETVEAQLVAHNTFLSSLFEIGLIGFLLFLLIVSLAVYTSIRFSRMWIAVFIVLFIGAMSLSWEHRKPTWLIMDLAIAYGSAEENIKKWNSHESKLLVNSGSYFDSVSDI